MIVMRGHGLSRLRRLLSCAGKLPGRLGTG